MIGKRETDIETVTVLGTLRMTITRYNDGTGRIDMDLPDGDTQMRFPVTDSGKVNEMIRQARSGEGRITEAEDEPNEALRKAAERYMDNPTHQLRWYGTGPYRPGNFRDDLTPVSIYGIRRIGVDSGGLPMLEILPEAVRRWAWSNGLIPGTDEPDPTDREATRAIHKGIWCKVHAGPDGLRVILEPETCDDALTQWCRHARRELGTHGFPLWLRLVRE